MEFMATVGIVALIGVPMLVTTRIMRKRANRRAFTGEGGKPYETVRVFVVTPDPPPAPISRYAVGTETSDAFTYYLEARGSASPDALREAIQWMRDTGWRRYMGDALPPFERVEFLTTTNAPSGAFRVGDIVVASPCELNLSCFGFWRPINPKGQHQTIFQGFQGRCDEKTAVLHSEELPQVPGKRTAPVPSSGQETERVRDALYRTDRPVYRYYRPDGR